MKIVDHPSQVYFPSELGEKQIDRNEVNKMYQFIIDRTKELDGNLQVIVVDHADLKKESFRHFMCEIGGPLTKISYQMIGTKCNNKKLQIVIDFIYCYFCSTSIVQSILAQKEN